MDIDLVKQNATILFNAADRNLTCDGKGEISVISKWNLIGRLIKWMSNRDGSVTKKVCRAAFETLVEIDRLNSTDPFKRFYVWHEEVGFTFFDATKAYSSYYPADKLVSAINNVDKFKQDSDIQKVSSDILKHMDLYPTVNKQDPSKTFDWAHAPLHKF